MADERVAALIEAHLRRYPEMEVADVYKLLHQGVFGPGHSIPNRKAAREWLEQESRLPKPDVNAPLVESVHPDDQIVRVYLRPYMATNGDLNALLDVYIRSAEAVTGDPTQMAARWAVFAELSALGGPLAGRFEPRSIRLMGRTRASEHWSAVHHSPRYEAHYKPTYRVLTVQHAADLLVKQRLPFQIVR